VPQHFPDFETFRDRAASHDVVPVYRQLLGDHLTPVTAFEVLGRDAHAFLLESVVGGEKVGRHSFIATGPNVVYTALHGAGSVQQSGRAPREFKTADPLRDLAELLPHKSFARDPLLPAFTGGLVGYAAYDLARYYEPEKLANAPKDDRGLPDMLFGLYKEIVVFDHVDKTIKVVANSGVRGPAVTVKESPEEAYRDACRRVDEIVQRLSQPSVARLGEIDPRRALSIPFVSNLSREQFEDAVRRGQDYIRAGDVFQFVPSQRLRVTSEARPFDVYRALRVINPSPFMFYLKSPSVTLIGSSPEILCRVQERTVTTRPLAGTRPRGTTDELDIALERELLDDPKEQAEHVMLVDLHRNDIGRVCKPGSVRVDERMSVERYSHVMHLTSNVSGQLSDGKNSLDALRVSLPVGTVSGAPKIRAMQIIDELEPTRRGPYGGAVGYLDFAGNMDTCIALRTIVWRNGVYDVQVGAGVVADSVPSREYDETMSKAGALLKAVEAAQRGF
jgi:anthranilate synthase component 1